jgi:hypothetical protein
MKWTKASMTSEDAQYLETRKFQRQEIAGIFRVPPHKIGDLERATFTNIEHQGMEYVTDCLMSYLVRWEQAMNYSLLTEREQGKYYFEFLVDGLLRGDIASRYTAYQTAINEGIMSANEVRAKENMNPREDGLGDVYMRSANTVPADTPVAPPAPAPNPADQATAARIETDRVIAGMEDAAQVNASALRAVAASLPREITVTSPPITVNADIYLPKEAGKKSIKFTKKPDGTMTGAEITEE